MKRPPQNIIVPETDSTESSLASPRFDHTAAQMARPVVPLSQDASHAHPTRFGLESIPLFSGRGLWLLAGVLSFIMAAGAMAIGVTTYRRNQEVSTQSLAPVAAATMAEVNQDNGFGQSGARRAAVAPRIKRRQPVATRPVLSGNPKARMVDMYVVR